jgi:hypothetical protein
LVWTLEREKKTTRRGGNAIKGSKRYKDCGIIDN